MAALVSKVSGSVVAKRRRVGDEYEGEARGLADAGDLSTETTSLCTTGKAGSGSERNEGTAVETSDGLDNGDVMALILPCMGALDVVGL